MRRCQVLMRDGLHYRRAAFEHGLALLGYASRSYVSDPGPDDLLVIWNRSFRGAEDAERFSRGGARIVVAENGLLGKGFLGGNWYSLAVGHVAGCGGHFPDYGPVRWDSLDVELLPWKTGGTDTIFLGQRGIGERGIKSPEGWAEARAALHGGRVRPHPGRVDDSVPLLDDLVRAKQVVTWASSAALVALMHGVPVFYEHHGWIGREAALPIAELGNLPRRDDGARLACFRRLAWAIWTIDEIENGSAFRCLLGIDPVVGPTTVRKHAMEIA